MQWQLRAFENLVKQLVPLVQPLVVEAQHTTIPVLNTPPPPPLEDTPPVVEAQHTTILSSTPCLLRFPGTLCQQIWILVIPIGLRKISPNIKGLVKLPTAQWLQCNCGCRTKSGQKLWRCPSQQSYGPKGRSTQPIAKMTRGPRLHPFIARSQETERANPGYHVGRMWSSTNNPLSGIRYNDLPQNTVRTIWAGR